MTDRPGKTSVSRRGFLRAAVGGAAMWRAAAAAAATPAVPAAPRKGAPAGGGALPPLEILAYGRLAFGPTPAELEEWRARKGTSAQRLAKLLEEQLHPESVDDKALDARLAALKLTTLSKDLKTLWADHVRAADAMRDKSQAEQKAYDAAVSSAAARAPFPPKPVAADDNKLRLQPVRELETAAWLRAVYSRRQLHEVLVDFWHDHFNVFAWDPQTSPVFVSFDRDVLRKHALGNFRELLEATATAPSMLFYLDNALSQSANPNENYARELFELHTLGAENYLGVKDRADVPGYDEGEPVGYVDGDVYEAARALTGWRVANGRGVEDTGEFLYYEPWHDRFQKIVLGRQLQELQPPMQDGRDVLDLLAGHPGTARYVCRKLCRRLVADEPPERLVADAARVFRAERKAPDQIRRVVRAIVLSEEFRTAWGRKMKRPFEATVSMLRATQAEFTPGEAFLNAQSRAGQRLFQWRTPDGYPDDRARWGGTAPTLERWRTANQLVNGAWDGVRVDLARRVPAARKSPREVARALCESLCGRAPSKATADAVAEMLAQGRNVAAPLPDGWTKERLAPAVALVLMSPEFQLK